MIYIFRGVLGTRDKEMCASDTTLIWDLNDMRVLEGEDKWFCKEASLHTITDEEELLPGHLEQNKMKAMHFGGGDF